MENIPGKNRFTGLIKNVQVFFADFILMSVGLALVAQLFSIAIPIAAVLSTLRFKEKHRKARWMFVAYWLLVILTIDTAVVVSLMAVLSFGPVFFITPPVVYLGILFARRQTGLFGYLTKIQLTLIPICLWCLMVILPIATGKDSSAKFSNTECARLVTPGHKKSYPIFVEERPARNDIIIGYKLEPDGPVMNFAGTRPSISRIDRITGEETVWLDVGRVLSMKVDKRTGETFAVVGKTDVAAMKDQPHAQLYIFSQDGKIEERHDLKLPRSTYYIANIALEDEKLIIVVEDAWFEYSRGDETLTRLDTKEITKGAPVYFLATSGDRLVGTFSSGYLLISLITGRRNLIAVDIGEMKFVKSRPGAVYGYYDIKHVPGTERFIVSHAWVKGGVMIDADLEPVAKVNIPAGVRNIAISNNGRTLAAGGFFDGRLHFIDLESNEEFCDVFVGKGIRGIAYTEDNHVLVGTKLGLIEVSPQLCR